MEGMDVRTRFEYDIDFWVCSGGFMGDLVFNGGTS